MLFNTSPEQLLSVLLSLKFYGKGGLMVDSTADSEECSSDLQRPPGNFRMRHGIERGCDGYSDVVLSLRPKRGIAYRSFLWKVQPDSAEAQVTRACWTETINTRESGTS